MIPQEFREDGKVFIDRLECNDCTKRIMTSTMTINKYRVLIEDYNEEV